MFHHKETENEKTLRFIELPSFSLISDKSDSFEQVRINYKGTGNLNDMHLLKTLNMDHIPKVHFIVHRYDFETIEHDLSFNPSDEEAVQSFSSYMTSIYKDRNITVKFLIRSHKKFKYEQVYTFINLSNQMYKKQIIVYCDKIDKID